MLCTETDCKNAAEYTYIWPWGAQGACCGLHRLHLMQRATQQLDTSLQFTVIDPGKPMPVSRDERAGLRAKIIVLEEDVQDLNGTIAQYHKANSEQAEEMRRLRGINERLQQEVNEALANLEQALTERDSARADCGIALQERDRLELLVRTGAPHDTTRPGPVDEHWSEPAAQVE